jgi:hypothetical protein
MTAVLRVPGLGVGETPVAEVNPAAAGDTVMGEAAPEPGELRSFFEELVGFLRDFSSAGAEPAEAAPATPTPPPVAGAVAAFLPTQPEPLTMPARTVLDLPVALPVAPSGEVAVITPLSTPGAVTPGLAPVATLPPLPSRPRRSQPLSAVPELVATPPEQLPASPVAPVPMRAVATTAATANQGRASTTGPNPQFRVPPYVAALSEELPAATPSGSTTRSGIPRRVRGHTVATAA